MAPGKVNPLSFAREISQTIRRGAKRRCINGRFNEAGIKKAAPALDGLRPRVEKSRQESRRINESDFESADVLKPGDRQLLFVVF
jgi:hypothetical protein